jgi:putative ABC transport system ATP-binding protein
MRIAALERVSRVYGSGPRAVAALADIDLAVRRGDFLAVVGPSGSGKTTLLNLLGCLDRPSTGRVLIGGRAVDSLPAPARARVRAQHLGFVFQNFNLIPVLSAAENVEYPLLLRGGVPARDRRRRVEVLLEELDLSDLSQRRPWELSSGQQQRVAIARALVGEPDLVLADEPTGNLDSAAGHSVIELLDRQSRNGDTAVVVATHDPVVVRRARQAVRLTDGKVGE